MSFILPRRRHGGFPKSEEPLPAVLPDDGERRVDSLVGGNGHTVRAVADSVTYCLNDIFLI